MSTHSPDQDLSFASELIKARTELPMTQAQLAEVSGVSRSAIKGYETGRNMPGARELRSLCGALRVTPNRLLFGTEAPLFGDSIADRFGAVMRADPEDAMLLRVRLATVAQMLSHDEAAALLTLGTSIAVARHGAERVEKALEDARLMATVGRTIFEEQVVASSSGKALDPLDVIAKVDAKMAEQPKSKVTKKTV
jgi:transcriptional regulator with XRE-family HTH domain